MATIFGILLILLIIALVLAVILTIMEKITKFVIPLIIIALLVVGAFYFVADVADLQAQFNTENKLFLLELEDQMVGAFSVKGEEQPVVLHDFSGFKNFQSENADSIINGYYKIIIIHWDTFEDIQEIDLDGVTISSQKIQDILKSGNPRQYLPGPAQTMFSTDDSMKGSIFLYLFSENNKNTNLIELYRSGNADFYPDTMSLKVIRLIPNFILNKLVKQ
ncbi:hypothetical protein KY333_02230 [Candidatus Woesearchaeota archaeon]|nr:hypothetical protein [Candidatus Woesearchaeota archaeon]